MRLYKYNDILQLLNLILAISIPILCLCFYKIIREKKFLILTLIIFTDLIILLLNIKYKHDEIPNIDDIFMILIGIKLLFLYYLQYEYNKGIFKFLLPIVCTILLLLTLKYGSISLNQIYDICLDIVVMNSIWLKRVRKKHREKDVYLNKLSINKKYITKISKEIEDENRYQQYLKDDIKLTNYKLSNIVEVINTPIIMMNAKYKCIMKNKYFDDFLMENNYSEENVNFISFINKINEKSCNDLKKIIEEDDIEKNYINLELYNKIYKIFVIKDFINDEKIILCQVKDITNIYDKENKLKQSELRYKTLMDVLSDGVIIHDGNTVNYINKIAMDIFGLDSSVNNVLDIANLECMICKKSKDEFLHNLVSVGKGLKDSKTSKLELENGKIIDFISCSFNMGVKKMILTIISDFTEHQMVIDKLEENKKTYSTLIQTLPEGIVLINRYSKEQVYTNKFMMRILGEMGVDKFYRIIDDYLQSGDYDRFRTFYIKNNDKKRKIFMAIKEVPKQDNLLIVIRDLEIENQIESIYNNLQFIKERNKFKTEFLGRAASNLKKPITTIFEVNKFLENKQDIYDYNGMKSYIKTVRQNSYRLKRLLNNIDEISKIEDGIYCRDYKTYDLFKYIERIVRCCEDYTQRKGLSIYFESNRKEVLIYMDKDKIEKIILNILSNALKFTERGGEIAVNLIVNNRDVIIAIEDNGSGIPSNKLDFIFENFEQVNRSLSREAEGTGVGLYLVKKLALIHHAQIKVNSKVGCGSKFEIILKDTLIDSTLDNRKKIEAVIIDNESIDLEFSDIYLE